MSEAGRPNIRVREYAAQLYKHFDDNAVSEVVDGRKIRVWNGYITQATNSIGIPDGSYRRVIALLEDVGSIQIIMRGARGYPSMVALLDAPTEDRLESPSVLTKRRDSATLTARTEDFIKSLGGLNIADAIVDIDGRVKALEATVARLERANAKKSK